MNRLQQRNYPRHLQIQCHFSKCLGAFQREPFQLHVACATLYVDFETIPEIKKDYIIYTFLKYSMFTLTCDSDIPSAKASFALSGPARYLVCSKVFSRAKICCPENVGRVCFFLPSESRRADVDRDEIPVLYRRCRGALISFYTNLSWLDRVVLTCSNTPTNIQKCDSKAREKHIRSLQGSLKTQ